MGISRYNAEGYHDPTAYEGIRLAEASAGKLKITYPTGYMELNLDRFFPCNPDKAEKVFSLIHRYSPEADKDRLLVFLRALAAEYFAMMQEYAGKAASCATNSDERLEYTTRFEEARRLWQKTATNIELFTAGRERG